MPAASDPTLQPQAGEKGLASWGADDISSLVLPAWDAFVDLVADVDLGGPSRVEGWTARDVCVHLGSWGGSRSVPMLCQEARTNPAGTEHKGATFDQDAHDEALLDAWSAAPREDVLDALRQSRDETAAYLASDDLDTLGHVRVRSSIGPLPLTTMVSGRAYELAVSALDLLPGATCAPPRLLLSAGLASLADTTGALAARLALHGSASLIAPEGGWTFATDGEAWRTLELPVVPDGWPRVEGGAAELLDAAAGRRNPGTLLARRQVRIHHPARLLAFASLVDVPGLPSGAALTGLVSNVRTVNRLLRRIPGVPG